MKLYIIRHGQTDFNLNNMVQGRGINAPLNETGQKQADAFYQAYRHVKFDKIYTSSLLRTVQTVQSFINDGVGYEQLSGLDEISWGSQEGVAFTPKSSTLYQETVKKWRKGQLDLAVGGGETPIEVMNRQKKAVQKILSDNHDTVLISMHGRAMRILLCWVLGYDLSDMDEFKHGNLCLYQLSYTGSSFRVDLFNEQGHLGSG